jgi:peptidoglycan-N-acetylglucosamine deacetylase
MVFLLLASPGQFIPCFIGAGRQEFHYICVIIFPMGEIRKLTGLIFALLLFLVWTAALSGCQPSPARKIILRAHVSPQIMLDRYWRNAKHVVDKSVLELIAQDQAELRKGVRHHKFIAGSPRRKWLALTIDDGPHPDYTPQLLAILKKYNVKATFFLVGEMAERHPELVRAEFLAGHEIGNHTYDHVNLTKIPTEEVATEIEACGDVLQSITKQRPRLFRPPGGDYNNNVAEAAEALGYTTVLWSDNAGDWLSPGEEVTERKVLRHASNGGVILIHDGYRQTLDLLPRLLAILKKDGYQFVTVDQMMPESYVPSLEVNPADL